MKRTPSKKKYWEMTTQELAEATKEFDQEFIADTFRPLNEEQRERWERMKRKPRRAVKPSNKKTISRKRWNV